MHIATLTGGADGGNLQEAIKMAEVAAQELLDRLSPRELHSVQAQTLITEYKFYHIITVVYE